MFGNKNRLSSDEIRIMREQLEESQSVFNNMEEAHGVFSADISEMKEALERLDQDANQSAANIESITEMAEQNIETEASLIHKLEEFTNNMKQLEEFHESIVQIIRNHAQDTQAVVEQNKHFTSPSKEIVEIPAIIRDNTTKSRTAVVKMNDCSKQMSVLALNAAIEAGRMGDQGKQFVKAAEEIRTYTANYGNAIAELQEILDEQEKWSAKIEEQIRHLVNLLKENNVSTGKLMKQNNELVDNIDKTDKPDLPGKISEIKDQVVGMRNADEEILKAEERNRMQIGYITEEVLSSRKNMDEVVEKVEPLFEKAGLVRDKIEKEGNEE